MTKKNTIQLEILADVTLGRMLEKRRKPKLVGINLVVRGRNNY